MNTCTQILDLKVLIEPSSTKGKEIEVHGKRTELAKDGIAFSFAQK